MVEVYLCLVFSIEYFCGAIYFFVEFLNLKSVEICVSVRSWVGNSCFFFVYYLFLCGSFGDCFCLGANSEVFQS